MAHTDSLRTKIAIADMHRLTDRILDVSDVFQNTNVTIHERVCVIPPPYYLEWFKISYPSVTINQDDGNFFLQYMNGIRVTKTNG